MIEFNLLPDVKLEYIKSQRNKSKFISISIIVAGASLSLFIILFLVVNVAQQKHIENLTKDIQSNSAKLESIQDIDKILTIQNQLGSMTKLHDDKSVASRLPKYLKQIVPSNVNIAKLDVDFANSTMTISGSADSLSSVNKFVDTLKFTDYKVGDKQDKAFSKVVLASFGRDDKGASYQITLAYEPVIFTSTQKDSPTVELIVPNTITSRSQTEKPADLFQPLSNTGTN